MTRFLLSMIPILAGYFALTFAVVAFGGDWPSWWIAIAGAFAGIALGTRSLLR